MKITFPGLVLAALFLATPVAADCTKIGPANGAVAKVVADLKAKGASLTVADVMAALKNEFEPRVAQYAKDKKCG